MHSYNEFINTYASSRHFGFLWNSCDCRLGVMGKRSDRGQHSRVTRTVPPPALGKERTWRHWGCRACLSKLQTAFHKETIPTGLTVQKESTQRAYKSLSVPLALKSHPQSLKISCQVFLATTLFFSFFLHYFFQSLHIPLIADVF